jgi:hypothetical protein
LFFNLIFSFEPIPLSQNSELKTPNFKLFRRDDIWAY